MSTHDLVIRGGTVVDGLGGPPRTADVAVDGGVISAIGDRVGNARREVAADGALVIPGFVDIHTHYDGQVSWDSRLAPSSWHGVTTVVMGNCGVGFAPVRPYDHDTLIELMEGVEEIPGTALHEGLQWDWETFPEYLDALARRPRDVDFAAQLPHGAMRLYAMGERGARRDVATADDRALMSELTEEAIRAGALGFSTSRTLNHRSATGEPTPSLGAAAVELLAIAGAVGRAGTGVLQVISDFDDLDAEFGLVREMARVSGRPLSVSILAKRSRPTLWRELLDRIAVANADGLAIRGQVGARGIGVLLGFDLSMHPFEANPVFHEIAHLPRAELLAALRDVALRERLIAAAITQRGQKILDRRAECDFERVYDLGDPPDYEPGPETSMTARAERSGRTPEEEALDLMLADDGHAMLYMPGLNYVSGNLDDVREMLVHPNTVPGLSDGGAHVGHICDVSYPTTLLAWWARDRPNHPLGLSFVVAAQCRRTAEAVGLFDRGVVAPGYRADLNVVDHQGLALHRPEVVYDLPSGGRRVVQRVDGYLHTFVAGQETYVGGEATSALPGRLVRGAQPAPSGSLARSVAS